MKKADMITFRNYLEYKLEISENRIKKLTEYEFNTLKNYFFKGEEGYELNGGYDEFKAFIRQNKR